MGGLGSGRPTGSGRDTVEACRSIDVNQLHRKGRLRADWIGIWQWTHEGERVAWINRRAARSAASHLSRAVRRGRVAGCSGDHPHRPRSLPLRWGTALFHLSRRVRWNRLQTARRHALWTWTLFPLPTLLSPRAREPEPERGRMVPESTARQQDQRTARRRSGHGRAFPAKAKGHVDAEHTNDCGGKRLTPRCMAIKYSRLRPSGCWLERAKPNGRGAPGDERGQGCRRKSGVGGVRLYDASGAYSASALAASVIESVVFF